MTLRELRNLLADEPDGNADLEVKVWLPGSRITLVGNDKTMIREGDVLMIEGNIDQLQQWSVINDQNANRNAS